MKTISIIFLLLIINSTIYGQQDKQPTKSITGTVTDSLTNETISFASIFIDTTNKTIADIDGNFKINFSIDKNIVLIISAVDYETKKVTYLLNNQPLTIKLMPIPHDIEKDFIIMEQPIDTIYNKEKKILQINYRHKDQITFYENGQMQSKTVNGSYREWFKNGQLKYQCSNPLIGWTNYKE